jgi:hypothetical protein
VEPSAVKGYKTVMAAFVNPHRRDVRVSFRNFRGPATSPRERPGLGGTSLVQVSHKFGASLLTDAAPPTYVKAGGL